MSYQARRITIIILLILTVVLAGVSIYIGIRTSQNQSAEDSNAGTCTWICNSCGCGCDDEERLNRPECTPTNGPDSDCRVDASVSCLTISSPSGQNCQFTLERYSRPMTGPNDDCFTSDNRESRTVGNGSYCTDGIPLCTCVQIDLLTNGQTVGNNWNGVGIKAGNWVDACAPGRVCGQTCVGSGQGTCSSGNTCQNGTCVANICATDPSKCETDKCTVIPDPEKSYSCTENYTCVELNDATGEFSDLTSCSQKCIPPGQPKCGDTCTSNSECPTDHTCQNGTCVLNGCTSTTCTNGCTPICGGPCGNGISCPVGHTCDTTQNRCVISSCLNNPSCTNNGCTLPQTSIYGDERDYVIYGLMLVFTGVVLYRFNALAYLVSAPSALASNYAIWRENKRQQFLARVKQKQKAKKNKEREKFERKVSKHAN